MIMGNCFDSRRRSHLTGATVAITAPHAYCKNKPSWQHHLCDPSAESLAMHVHTALANEKHKTRMFISYTPRWMTDLNRKEGRGIGFRKQLAHTDFDVIIDCHSFPANSRSFRTKHVRYPEVALLYLAENINFVKQLFDLVQYEFRATLIQGSYQNDIMASFLNVPSVLIEVSESLSETELSRLADIVAAFITNYFATIA